MANPFFSFTKRDYEGSRVDGMSKIPIYSNGVWTDLNAGDPGVVLLDYMHALLDMCNYYLDHQALESFLATSKERANLFRHAANYLYQIRGATGAVADVNFYVPDSDSLEEISSPILVPRGTEVTSKGGLTFYTLESAVITERGIPVTVPAAQGEVIEEIYTGTGVVANDEADTEVPTKNQEYRLTNLLVDISTLEVSDSSGVLWERVDHIAFADNGAKSYQVIVEPEGGVILRFGNNIRGYAPALAEVLTIAARQTAGAAGNLSADAISGTLSLEDGDGVIQAVTYTNPTPSVGGSDRETDSEIKENTITTLKSLGRAVTTEDYERLSKSVPGVREARVYDYHSNPDFCLPHEVKVIVISEDASASSEALAYKVKQFLNPKTIPPTNLIVSTPVTTTINLTLSIRRYLNSNLREDSLDEQVREHIQAYFDAMNVGDAFEPIDLAADLKSNFSAIRSVLSFTPNDIVEVAANAIAVLGTLTINYTY